MISIIIAENQALIRNGLAALFNTETDIRVTSTVGDTEELWSRIASEKPDIILLSLFHPRSISLDVTRQIDKKMPWVKVISILNNNHPYYIKELLKSGAKGFLSKRCSTQELFDGVRNVFHGKTFFCSHCSSALLRDIISVREQTEIEINSVTPREIEIIGFLSEGYTTKQIAEKLFISGKTVERHKSNLLAKLKANNTAHLIKIAFDHGLLF